MIHVDESLERTIRDEAARAYPEECCGVLLGRDGEAGSELRRVLEVRPVANARQGERGRRYLIAPEALLGIEKEAREQGLDVVGFYHSHPDHRAEPSDFDREHAWPWYSYVIVPVRRGAPGMPRSWRLADDRSGFHEETTNRPEEE